MGLIREVVEVTPNKDFCEWMYSCNYEFKIAYNRYGYRWGHGFLCVCSDRFDSDINDVMEDIEGGDIEAFNAVEYLTKKELEGYIISMKLSPSEAVESVQYKLRTDYNCIVERINQKREAGIL